MKLLFVDFETGGLDPWKNSPLSLGYIVYDSKKDEVLDKGHIYIEQREYRVTADALRINGLDLLKVTQLGIPEFVLITRLEKLYKQHGKLILTGWNVKFDYDFMRAMFLRNSSRPLFERIFYYKPLDICSMYFLVRGEMKRLDDAAKDLGIEFSEVELHSADVDVELTLKVYQKLKELIDIPEPEYHAKVPQAELKETEWEV